MTRNLRAAVALVYRSIGSRSFSSPAGNGRGSFERSVMEILMEKPAKTNGDWMVASTVFGCACYMGLELVAARKAAKLLFQRRDELIAKRKRLTHSNE